MTVRLPLFKIRLTDVLAALRIEWCRARARAMRWSEEVLLLEEEMRRVLRFLEWHAKWWEDQQGRHTNLSPAEEKGMRAYALRQAGLRRALRKAFYDQWAPLPGLIRSSSRHPELANR